MRGIRQKATSPLFLLLLLLLLLPTPAESEGARPDWSQWMEWEVGWEGRVLGATYEWVPNAHCYMIDWEDEAKMGGWREYVELMVEMEVTPLPLQRRWESLAARGRLLVRSLEGARFRVDRGCQLVSRCPFHCRVVECGCIFRYSSTPRPPPTIWGRS